MSRSISHHPVLRRQAAVAQRRGELSNPACEIGPGQDCRHPLVNEALNAELHRYETAIGQRFYLIEAALKKISAIQHDDSFVQRAQGISQEMLGYDLPEDKLTSAWVSGLDMPDLHAYCVFQSLVLSVQKANEDRAPWLNDLPLSPPVLRNMGYHTVNISPCADGRLQGLLPFTLRMTPAAEISVKAFAGARFDIEDDIADWTQSELQRFANESGYDASLNYLKCVVYHFSSSAPCDEGCAAHGSNDDKAVHCAIEGLADLQSAIRNLYGHGAEPDGLVLGVDTDTDALRVHLADGSGAIRSDQFLDSAQLFSETLALSSAQAEQLLADRVRTASPTPDANTVALAIELLRANFSQLQYVIEHHDGRYSDVGHDEKFICAGEAVASLHLRNQYYFAHLSTVEEGAADLDVGIKIFTALNLSRGLAIPILVHFLFDARVSGARQRAEERCRRVKHAIEARYQALHDRQQIRCFLAVSDIGGTENVTPVPSSYSAAIH
jgi:carboxysome shell carbonic anhydrase